MNILTFNCGSSSQGFKVFHITDNQNTILHAAGKAKNVATKSQASASIEWQIHENAGRNTTNLSSHRLAAKKILELLIENQLSIDAIGHRIVHGGPDFEKTTQVDNSTMKKLHAGFHYAPVHNENSYRVIEVCQEILPNIPQYVVFDTSFHANMPEYTKQYAIPRDIAETYAYRKYGFHGLSYQYVANKTEILLGKP